MATFKFYVQGTLIGTRTVDVGGDDSDTWEYMAKALDWIAEAPVRRDATVYYGRNGKNAAKVECCPSWMTFGECTCS